MVPPWETTTLPGMKGPVPIGVAEASFRCDQHGVCQTDKRAQHPGPHAPLERAPFGGIKVWRRALAPSGDTAGWERGGHFLSPYLFWFSYCSFCPAHFSAGRAEGRGTAHIWLALWPGGDGPKPIQPVGRPRDVERGHRGTTVGDGGLTKPARTKPPGVLWSCVTRYGELPFPKSFRPAERCPAVTPVADVRYCGGGRRSG